MKTKKEFSAGGVVYKQLSNQKYVFLLGKHSGYHKWVLPKGMIEKGETEQMTAIRETMEEMAVQARVVSNEPIHIEKYWYVAEYKKPSKTSLEAPKSTRRVLKYQEEGGIGIKVDKTVIFFLMEYELGDPKNHGWEMEDADWFSASQALEKMSFEGEKKALEKAIQILTEH